jgi:hypothetical protein
LPPQPKWSMTTTVSKAANLCRDLPPMGRPKFPLYPSRYQHLLVEVPLFINRGAGLAPPIVGYAARRAGQYFWPASDPASTRRRVQLSLGGVTVNSWVDFSKTKFFCHDATIFAESMCN